MLNDSGEGSNKPKLCIQHRIRAVETARSIKACLLNVWFCQNSVPENFDNDPRKRLPEENAGSWGKHGGSTARHTAHELAQHKFGTRLA